MICQQMIEKRPSELHKEVVCQRIRLVFKDSTDIISQR